MDNEKLTACQTCGAEIAADAKTCPHCGAKNKVKKPVYKRPWFWILIVAVVIIMLPDTRSETQEPKKPAQDVAEQTQNTDPKPEKEPEEDPEEDPEPFVIPEDAVYTGSGDNVLTIDPFDGPYVFWISGNDAGRHFSVTSYDEAGNYLDLLVNTSDPSYSGILVDVTQTTSMMEVKATGDWKIVVSSMYNLPAATPGMTCSGSGDGAFLFSGDVKTATITGNAEARHFAVKAYGAHDYDLLVNTTDPYEGTTLVKCEPFLFIVDAVGDWTFSFE